MSFARTGSRKRCQSAPAAQIHARQHHKQTKTKPNPLKESKQKQQAQIQPCSRPKAWWTASRLLGIPYNTDPAMEGETGVPPFWEKVSTENMHLYTETIRRPTLPLHKYSAAGVGYYLKERGPTTHLNIKPTRGNIPTRGIGFKSCC